MKSNGASVPQIACRNNVHGIPNMFHEVEWVTNIIIIIISDNITRQNCHKTLFCKSKAPQPSIIDGHTREQQPEMWREYYKTAYEAEETPYTGDLLQDISNKLLSQQFHFSLFRLKRNK